MAEYIYGDGCIGKTKYIYNLCRIIGVNNIHIDNIVCIINNFANINFLVNKIRTDIKNGSSKTEPFLLLYDEFDKHVTSLINEYKWFITNYKQQCAMTGSDDDKDNMYIHSRSTKRQNTNVDLNDVNKGILNSINLFTSSLFILKFLGNQNIKEIINTSDIKHSYVTSFDYLFNSNRLYNTKVELPDIQELLEYAKLNNKQIDEDYIKKNKITNLSALIRCMYKDNI